MKQIVFTLSLIIALAGSLAAQTAFQLPGDNAVADQPHKELYIPNAFTPNGDGLNDYFKIINLSTEKVIDFRVFNRWGTILYRSGDNQAAWDGRYKGKMEETGVYGYVMKIGYADGSIITYKGTVMLIH